jgi:hypothetical protein
VRTKIPTGTKTLRWVNVKELRISPRAQRNHTSPGALALIEEIAQNFDPEQFGTLTVNHRDGTYWVVDGGHRRCSLTKMGYEDQQVQCWVYENLSEQEEADLFLALNNVRVVNAMDKFKVAVVAGRVDESIVDSVVRNVGMSVGSGRTNTIRCVTALMKVYERGGAKVLERTVRIIRDAYGDAGFSARITEGIGMFVANYENTFSEERLVAKLSRKLGGVNGLLGRAEQIKSSHGVNTAVAVAAATTETYNQGRGGGKLEGWWSTLEQKESA